jgi:hypothetical protein
MADVDQVSSSMPLMLVAKLARQVLHQPFNEVQSMNIVWQQDRVSISGIATAKFEQTQLWVSGTGWNKDIPFDWTATALSTGWLVEITRFSGKVGQYQGATFNLPLEIAVAVKRLM